jgi:hypothetical protein
MFRYAQHDTSKRNNVRGKSKVKGRGKSKVNNPTLANNGLGWGTRQLSRICQRRADMGPPGTAPELEQRQLWATRLSIEIGRSTFSAWA